MNKTEKRKLNKKLSETKSARPNRLVAPLLSWFSENARDLPWRRTRDPYAIWVSEIMLQQTQVTTVLPFWTRWMRELPHLNSLAAASSEKIHKLWEGLGYYSRVRNMQKSAQLILAKHGGQFPQEFNKLLALPGIGRYTAGAICSIAFNQPEPVLDGNVIRVLTRVFGIPGNPREKKINATLWELACQLVNQAAATDSSSPSSCSHFNQGLMELGALICTPTLPACLQCPLRKACFAFRHQSVEKFPNTAKRAPSIRRRFAAFVLKNKGRFWVRRRPDNVVNAHLWEFPNVEVLNGESEVDRIAAGFFGRKTISLERFCTIQHSITRYRITLEAFAVAKIKKPPSSGVWKSVAAMQKLPFAAAHRKILAQLLSKRKLKT